MIFGPMANLVVYVELDAALAPDASSRHALGCARGVANALGATVYGLVAVPPAALGRLDAVAQALGAAGADRGLAFATDAVLPLYETHGNTLERVAATLRPRFVVFPVGMAAVQLAPLLAARLSGTFFPGAQITVSAPRGGPGSGLLRLSRLSADLETQYELDGCEADRVVVCTLAAGPAPTLKLGHDAELELLSVPPGPPPRVAARAHAPGWGGSPHTLLVSDKGRATADALAAAWAGGVVHLSPSETCAWAGLLCPRVLAVATRIPEQAWPPPFALAVSHRMGLATPRPRARALPPGEVRWKAAESEARAAFEALVHAAGAAPGSHIS